MLPILQMSEARFTIPRVFGWTPSVSQKLGSQQTIMWRWPWYLWRNSRPTLRMGGISGISCWCDRIWEPQKDAHFVAFLVSFLSKGPLGFTPGPSSKMKVPLGRDTQPMPNLWNHFSWESFPQRCGPGQPGGVEGGGCRQGESSEKGRVMPNTNATDTVSSQRTHF